jgi:predicted lipoprotein with Yx(FWY)xxD motif
MSNGTLPRPRMRGARGAALVCGVALALSAFGLTAGAAAAKTKPVVATAKIAGLGTVLVDARGRTLYTLTNGAAAVPCSGACVALWPPLTVPAGRHLTVAKGVKGLKLTTDARQVAAHGLPLYRYAGDTAAKQANGEGANSFGGTWHVVKVAAKTKSSTPAPTTARSSGY